MLLLLLFATNITICILMPNTLNNYLQFLITIVHCGCWYLVSQHVGILDNAVVEVHSLMVVLN